MDIIERLQDDELYVDAIDDAIAEIEQLRREVTTLRKMLHMTKQTMSLLVSGYTPEEDATWKEL